MRNARAARLARVAVDIAGMGAVVLDNVGRIAWRSPQATRWLAEAFESVAAPACLAWLAQAVTCGQNTTGLLDGRQLLARHVGMSGYAESTVLLDMANLGERLHKIALTPRETEVLSWLAKGKTNRDIGDILGMSPRTVNKHLEHIFEKLGVETRTAAVAAADRVLRT